MSLEVKSNPSGVTVTINGFEVPELIDVQLTAKVDEAGTVTMTTYATREVLARIDHPNIRFILATEHERVRQTLAERLAQLRVKWPHEGNTKWEEGRQLELEFALNLLLALK